MQFDLQFEDPIAGAGVRRAQLVAEWLGDRLASNSDLTVRDGLISVFPAPNSALLEETSRSAGAGFLENVAVFGTTTQIGRHLDTLAQRSHPWLRGLDIACEDGGDVIGSARTAALIAATPCLRVLQVSGHYVFEEFRHPSVRTLTIDGFDAIRTLCGTGPAFPAVVELDLAFQGCGEIRDPSESMLSQMLLEAQLPALRRLDLSRNEPGPLAPNHQGGNVSAFDLLRVCRIRRQLTHVRMPALRSSHDIESLQAALTNMQQLVELSVAQNLAEPAEFFHPSAMLNIPVD